MIIAIDGPAGAGKSTIARNVALRLGFLYIDTGAMYRALTLKVIEHKIDLNNIEQIILTAQQSKISLVNNPDGTIKVILDGKDVSKEIREPRVTKFVSQVAKIKEVRAVMVELQRKSGQENNSVLDGRDIGTVVFPNAEKKFFLDAGFDTRVERRHKELVASGLEISLEEVALDLSNRDKIDSTREVAPLKKAADAVYVDTTNMSIEQVIDKVLSYIR